MTPKLTLDYGMRFTHHGPQYDKRQQASNFFPDKWQASQAPQLYQPGCSVATRPVSGHQPRRRQSGDRRVARHRVGGGDRHDRAEHRHLLNGIIQQGHGIDKENYVEPSMVVRPARRRRVRPEGRPDHRGPGQPGLLLRSRPGGLGVRPERESAHRLSRRRCTTRRCRRWPPATRRCRRRPSMLVYYYNAKIGSSLDLERRRADGPAVVVHAGRLVRGQPQLQLGRVRRHPGIPTNENADRPERAGHRDGVSAAVPGSDAGHEHDPGRDGATRPTCCGRIAASAPSTPPGRGSGRTTIRCRWPSTAA